MHPAPSFLQWHRCSFQVRSVPSGDLGLGVRHVQHGLGKADSPCEVYKSLGAASAPSRSPQQEVPVTARSGSPLSSCHTAGAASASRER